MNKVTKFEIPTVQGKAVAGEISNMAEANVKDEQGKNNVIMADTQMARLFDILNHSGLVDSPEKSIENLWLELLNARDEWIRGDMKNEAVADRLQEMLDGYKEVVNLSAVMGQAVQQVAEREAEKSFQSEE